MSTRLDSLREKSIDSVKGVGAARRKLLGRVGISNVYELLTYFPKDYEDRTKIKNIADLQNMEVCSFEGTIVSNVGEIRPKKGMTIQKVTIRDSSAGITAYWFNQPYIKTSLRVGESYYFFGRIERKGNKLQTINPSYELVDKRGPSNSLKVLPIYPLTKDLKQNTLRTLVREALNTVAEVEDTLPDTIIKEQGLESLDFSIKNIHFPDNTECMQKARSRLAFEELFLMQLGLLSFKSVLNNSLEGISFKGAGYSEDLLLALPFELTEAQKRVVQEIRTDMESHKPMNRLVQGDVGSGKTVIALIALFKAVKCGYQGALMAPTEILAEQHFNSIKPILDKFAIRVELLSGSLPKKQKQEITKQLSQGEIDIIVGTHALIEDTVQFKQLGLVVTDEQHRFGVRQRSVLAAKGANPDVLVMTATPIPRTLALILYGDLDISVIDQLPPGRKPIKTYAVNEAMRDRINKFIREKVLEGRQVYIVCPLVEESEQINAKSAVETAGEFKTGVFKDLKVGIIHGQMKSKEKEEIMRSFVNHEISILVSTTIIEVGVNVPNSTVMVIENAEKFGLAQLHQLRGRVGRGAHQSYCILFNQSSSEVAKERMSIMQSSNDGFVISEKDLEIRGPGDFFGTRQHGLPELKVANLYRDMDILLSAQQLAKKIVEDDPRLEKIENAALSQYIKVYFGGSINEGAFSI